MAREHRLPRCLVAPAVDRRLHVIDLPLLGTAGRPDGSVE